LVEPTPALPHPPTSTHGGGTREREQRRGLDTPAGALALVWDYGGRVIGDAALWLSDETRQVAEIGWVMDPAYAGQGLATEAVAPLLTLAFDSYGLHRVTAQMDASAWACGRKRICGKTGGPKANGPIR